MKRISIYLMSGFLLVIVTACIPQNRMVQEWKVKAMNHESYVIQNQIFDAECNSILVCNNDREWSGAGRLIKINRKGEMLWSVDLPANITAAVDANGYLYAVGYKKESSETGTVYRAVMAKYTPDGEQVWIIFDSPGIAEIGLECPFPNLNLSIDKNQDIIIFGHNGICKFNPNGEMIWIQAFSIEKLTSDAGGDIYAIEDSGVLKISGVSGELIWQNEIDNTGVDYDFFYLRSLAIDNHGNVIVMGALGNTINDISSYPERIDGHSFLFKFAPDGSQLWERIYPNPESKAAIWTYAYSSDVTVDSKDNIIATFEGTICNLYLIVPNPVIWTTIAIVGVGSSHAEIAKYDAEGGLLWKEQADSGGINEPKFGKLYVDRQDGIYLDSSNRLFHYDMDGGLIWSLIKCPLEVGSRGLSESIVDMDGNPYLFYNSDSRNGYLAKYKHVTNVMGRE